MKNKFLKGYWVDCGAEWGEYVHGFNATDAKKMFWSAWHGECDWIDLGVVRVDYFDNKPINRETVREYNLTFGEGWYPICKCGICKTKESE